MDKGARSTVALLLYLVSVGRARNLNLTAENIAGPVLVFLVAFPIIATLFKEAFPSSKRQQDLLEFIARGRLSVMTRRRVMRVILAIVVIAVVWFLRIWAGRELLNRAPEIAGVLASKTVVSPFESIQVRAVLSDPNGPADISTIDWEADPPVECLPASPDRQDVATCIAPAAPGPCTISVTVTDSVGKLDTASTLILVVPPP